MEELRLLGVRKMRNKILLTFIGVVIVNFCLAFLLFRYNGTDLGIKNTIILLLGSYIVYGMLNLYLLFLKKTNQEMNYNLLLIMGMIVCIISLCIFVLNLKNDTILYFPMMYIVAMLSTFINWYLMDRKAKNEKDEVL